MVWTAFIYHGNLDELMSLVTETLRPLLKQFEAENWIKGFNYNFYSGQDAHMSLRLDLRRKHERQVKKELNKLSLKPKVEEYAEQDKIAKLYELGSRWAFVLQDQTEKRRFQKEWVKDENFIVAFHGLCNSLLLGYYEEIAIHLKAIGRIGVTLGKFDEIKHDLMTTNQKCVEWFVKPRVSGENVART